MIGMLLWTLVGLLALTPAYLFAVPTTPATTSASGVATDRPPDTACDPDILRSSYYHSKNEADVMCRTICPPNPAKLSNNHRDYCSDNCPDYCKHVVEDVVDKCSNDATAMDCMDKCLDIAASSTSTGSLFDYCQHECPEVVQCIERHACWNPPTPPTSSKPVAKRPPANDMDRMSRKQGVPDGSRGREDGMQTEVVA